jgi:hypothetical protein
VKGEKREKKTPHFDEVFIKLREEFLFFSFLQIIFLGGK